MILLRCSTCGLYLELADDTAGQTASCPRCRHTMPVPSQPVAAAATGPSDSMASGSVALPAFTPVRGEAETVPPTALPVSSDPDKTIAADAIPPGTPPECYDFLTPAQAPGELGRLGPYRVLSVLGAGGMGVVFRAEDPQLQRIVALKAMLPTLAVSSSARQRFLREARAAAAIDDDRIVHIYQVGEDRGIPFLAMQFLRGEPLDALLARLPRLSLPEVLRIGREIAQGLAAAHARGLIHRDIKPANIWLETVLAHAGRPQAARVKILDFGLARAAGGDMRLTQPGAIMGTPGYMAPEQTSGQADHRCDLFSLGCVLYRMATGQLPFRATDPVSTLMAVATEHPRPPRELVPNLPAALDRLILDLLAKAPADRPASAAAVAEAFRDIENQIRFPRFSELAARLALGLRGAVGSLRRSRPAARTATPRPPVTAAPSTEEALWSIPAPLPIPPLLVPRPSRRRLARVLLMVALLLLGLNLLRWLPHKPVVIQSDNPGDEVSIRIGDKTLFEVRGTGVPTAAVKAAKAYLEAHYPGASIVAREMPDSTHALFRGILVSGQERRGFRLYLKSDRSRKRWEFDRLEQDEHIAPPPPPPLPPG